MAGGAVFDSLNSASILASSSASLKGCSDTSGEVDPGKLGARSVDKSEGLFRVAMTRRKIILCPTTRRISDRSCSVIPARMVSDVTWCSASVSTRAAGIPCLEQNLFSQGEQSPVWSAFLEERLLDLGGMIERESKACTIPTKAN